MTDVPLAGWPAEYPEVEPTRAMLLVYDDLNELYENSKIGSNEAWLFKFARNALDLDKQLNHYAKTDKLHIVEIYNWFNSTLAIQPV